MTADTCAVAAACLFPGVARETAAISVVLIAEDRLLLESLPENQGPLVGVRFVGRALDLPRGRELILQYVPRVALLDGPSFRSGFRILAEQMPIRLKQVRLAAFVDELTDSQLELAVTGGVRGLLSRRDSLEELGAALRSVAGGAQSISPVIRQRVEAGSAPGGTGIDRCLQLRDFSNRQLEVLILLAEGKRVKDIADAMHLSEKAVESHKYRLMTRLGIHDRVELCRWAIREGLISA